jgi:1-phosphofructokinase
MPKIITVTAHTAFDQVMTLDSFALGDTLTARSSQAFLAGKGINVAKTLVSLGHPVTALGIVGQQSYNDFETLQSALLQTDFTLVSGKTRTNITLTTPDTGQETHIRTAGYIVTAADCAQLIAQVKAHTQSGDIVVLSGSLPPGAPADLYSRLIAECHLLTAHVFLDSSGEALKAALPAQPYLIKPNHHELEKLTGKKLTDEQAIVDAAQSAIRQGIQWVVVSRGQQGALVVTGDQVLSATIAADLKPMSTIGCGDAMVAGLALAKIQGDDIKAALTLGIACGIANLFTVEPGRFDKNLLADIRNQVFVQSL